MKVVVAAAPVRTWRMYALDDAGKGRIAAVTEAGEFATVLVGPRTVVHRMKAPIPLEKVRAGYVLRCVGSWGKVGGEFDARSVEVGGTVDDIKLSRAVAAACRKIGSRPNGISAAAVAPPPAAKADDAAKEAKEKEGAAPAAGEAPKDGAAASAPAAAPAAPADKPTEAAPGAAPVAPATPPATPAPATP
jgi:hypothetical protein